MVAKQKSNLIERPPVVVVLGHIDHGKTTLLDYIRKTNVAAKESGSITQHIGAYDIEHNGKKIAFIDTPGHEAFSKMRSRGASVADIAILVVAADEGLKPQTLEALEHIQFSKVPFIVATNKMDKPGADPNKVKQQLAEKGVLLEGWGGTISNQEISAKTGAGISELLDLILLTAEMEELEADPSIPAEGVVIESRADSKVGSIATLLIKNGTLKVGDFIVAGSISGKIKKMEDAKGLSIESASLSTPVQVTGFDSLPSVGEEFYVVKNKKAAEEMAELHKKTAVLGVKLSDADKSGKKIINILLKGDAAGTKEALEKLTEDLVFADIAASVLKSDVGDINENDIKFARSTGAIIAGFKVKIPAQAAKLADQQKIKIIMGDIIYETIDKIKEEMSKYLEPETTRHDIGTLKVLATFKMDKLKMIVGGKVMDGKIKKGVKIEVKRNGESIMTGKLTQLQHNKENVAEVVAGKECGIAFAPDKVSEQKIEVGDILEIFEEEIKQKVL